MKDGQAVSLTPSTDYPVNVGMACPKGWEALTPLQADDRATVPMMREERDGELVPTDWDRALVVFAERFKEIQDKYGGGFPCLYQHGSDCG